VFGVGFGFGFLSFFHLLLRVILGILSSMRNTYVGFPFLSKFVISPSIFGSFIFFHICASVVIVCFLLLLFCVVFWVTVSFPIFMWVPLLVL